MTLEEFNQISESERCALLTNCCGSPVWVKEVNARSPYGEAQTLLQQGQHSWYQVCNESEWREAFEHHPRIGDKKNNNEKVKDTARLARDEQAGVKENDEELLSALHTANLAYENKFGFTFIVCASGKSGREMLDLLRFRMKNSPEEEVQIAMGEQWKITILRLKKILSGTDFPGSKSQVTTHILDTSAGKPATGIAITLSKYVKDEWLKISAGITDKDGRVSEFLPEGVKLDESKYKLLFATETYFTDTGRPSFYPEIEIIFYITDQSHYHIPLLLNPFGYSTYRGS